jgi:DNA end-binding protein Ku
VKKEHAMPKAFWKGAINFGMVVIPVRMTLATKGEKPSFHFLHRKCMNRVKQVLYCPVDDEYLDNNDIVRGYEYVKGRYVVVEDQDFEKIPLKTTHTIDVSAFVQEGEIEPLYFYDAHYLVPEEISAKPFALLRQALLDTGCSGIGKVAFQRREHLCSIRPHENVLMLHTLHYQHEIRGVDGDGPPESAFTKDELKMAKSLINEMITSFKPQQYRDEYKAALQQIIQAKLEGEEVVAPKVSKTKATPDLMAALRQSIESARERKEKIGAVRK